MALSEFSSIETRDEHNEEDGEGDEVDEEGKLSMLRLFLIAIEDEDKSSCTPKSLSPPTTVPL